VVHVTALRLFPDSPCQTAKNRRSPPEIGAVEKTAGRAVGTGVQKWGVQRLSAQRPGRFPIWRMSLSPFVVPLRAGAFLGYVEPAPRFHVR
jgi:hypothetical protein